MQHLLESIAKTAGTTPEAVRHAAEGAVNELLRLVDGDVDEAQKLMAEDESAFTEIAFLEHKKQHAKMAMRVLTQADGVGTFSEHLLNHIKGAA